MGRSRHVSAMALGRLCLATALICLLFFPSPCFCVENLIPNPQFIALEEASLSPHFWYHGESRVAGVKKSEFTVGLAGTPPVRALGIRGGEDRQGEWWCKVDGLEIGRKYLFSFMAYRDRFDEGVYPEVEFFGVRVALRNHLTVGGWQTFSWVVEASSDVTVIRFVNNEPALFYFSSPVLTEIPELDARTSGRKFSGKSLSVPSDGRVVWMPRDFPLVAYGGHEGNLDILKEMGFSGVVATLTSSGAEGMMGELRRRGLSLVARTSEQHLIEKLASDTALLGWYVEDEPEGRSVPVEKILNHVQTIRAAGSRHPTFMALVRPEFAGYYGEAADVLLMDQYPIPTQPLTWLSRSMDEARKLAGGKEVWAVIQIFGGAGYEGTAWSRQPTYEEMKALSYLAIVHGAKGLFFFTAAEFEKKGAEPSHRETVKRLIQELRHLTPQFVARGRSVSFDPEPPYEYAFDGSRPVHSMIFQDGNRLHLVAVNVLDRQIRGKLVGLDDKIGVFDEFFSGKRHVVRNGNIVDSFKPYEVKIFTAGRNHRQVVVRDRDTATVKANLFAEVAETPQDWSVGLMFRADLSEGRGLLFQGERLRGGAFYALNVRHPFDMVFADKMNAVTAVTKAVAPCFDVGLCRFYQVPSDTETVLELREGTIDKKGIRVGDILEIH